jgi:hypothetical protein
MLKTWKALSGGLALAARLALLAAVVLVPVAAAQVGPQPPPAKAPFYVTIKSDGLHPQTLTDHQAWRRGHLGQQGHEGPRDQRRRWGGGRPLRFGVRHPSHSPRPEK